MLQPLLVQHAVRAVTVTAAEKRRPDAAASAAVFSDVAEPQPSLSWLSYCDYPAVIAISRLFLSWWPNQGHFATTNLVTTVTPTNVLLWLFLS